MLRRFFIITLTAVILTGVFTPGRRWQENASGIGLSSAKEHAAAFGAQSILQSLASFDTEEYLIAKEYPKGLIELYVHYPETRDFVLQYYKKKDLHPEYDLSAELVPGQIPHLLQWDERWGYEMYADEIMAVSGCGPMALVMGYRIVRQRNKCCLFVVESSGSAE